MKFRKGDIEIEASKKAFLVIYKSQGYVPVQEETVKEESEIQEEEKSLENMTVPQLKELAKANGIEGASSLNKKELLSVLKDVL